MSWTIERRGRVAVVTMATNPVNAQNRAFFADLHEAFDRLERDHAALERLTRPGRPGSLVLSVLGRWT
jgi:enoyl-CoA hydratase/carnithine racemase